MDSKPPQRRLNPPGLGSASAGRDQQVGSGRRDGASFEPAVLSALRQLRLIIVGATIGAICGSLALRTSDDIRPVAVAVAAGAVLLGLTFAMQLVPSRPVPRLAPAYSSLIGRAIVTLAAALSVLLVFNLLVAPDPRGVPPRPNAQATIAPVPAAPSQIAGPTTPAGTVVPVAPAVPASPQQGVPPPTATVTESSARPATVQTAASPAATSPVSPFATQQAPPPSPPPSAAAATSPAASVAPATPQPTPVPSPLSIIPTLPPLPTIRLP